MSALPVESQLVESPCDAARRLSAGVLLRGYRAEALHEYRDTEGKQVLWRIRCKHPDTGEKWIRPMHWTGTGYVIGEPEAPKAGRVLYCLPELLADPAATVWVVEGETCADALMKAGKVATTSGSASSAIGADWTPMHGRIVRLWPDHDAPGAKYADAVEAILRALGCTVERIDAAALGLPIGGDVVDWLAGGGDLDGLPFAPPAVRQEVAHAWASEPEPLRRPVPAPEPYPLNELGPILAPAAESLRRVIQAPDAVCGASILAAASLAVQAQADVDIDGRIIPLSLWLLSVAESGERKSAVDAEAMRAAREYEKAMVAAADPLLVEHAARMTEWDARVGAAKKACGKAKGSGLADALREIGPAPPAPLLPRVIVGDFTAEGLAKLLAAGLPSVGAFTDEAALVLGGHGMTKETVMRTAATLCKLWDGGTLDRVRAQEGAVKLYGRRLALHMMAQPVIAQRALANDVLAGQGFLARCLLSWPQSTAGRRAYCAESLADDPAMGRLTHRLDELHRLPLPLADYDRQELKPRRLRLSEAAKNDWVQLHDAVEREMRPGRRFAGVRAWASKTPEQVARIAGVLAMVIDCNATEIDVDTLGKAAELALWHLGEAARLADTAELSQEVRDAEALLAWCHETGRRLMYSRDALRLGPARIRERETFMLAMGELERAGWAAPVEGGAVLDGSHRRNVWNIAPATVDS